MPNASRPRRPSSIAGLFRVAPLAAMLALYTLAAALFVFTVTGTGAGGALCVGRGEKRGADVSLRFPPFFPRVVARAAVDPEPLAFETRTVTTISMPTAVHTAVFEIWSGVEASGFPASPTPTPAVPTATQAVSALPTRRNEATSTPIGASRRLKKRIFGLWAEQDKAIEEASGSAQVVEKIQPEASDDIHAVTFQSNNSDDIPIGASEGSEPDYYGTEVSTDDMINNEARRLAKRAICDAYCRFALQQSRSSSLVG